MKKCIKWFPAFMVGLVAITGCGGGGDSSTTTTSVTSLKGYYIDSAVSGVQYTCGSKTGTTDSEGAFYFDENQSCVFSFGDIQLRTVAASALQNGVQIIENNVTTARFLQSMDFNGIAGDGIQLAASTKQALVNAGRTSVPSSDAEIDDVVNLAKSDDANFSGSRISLVDAKAHVDSTTLIQDDSNDTLGTILSHDGYLQKLRFAVNMGGSFGWDANTSGRLATTLSYMDDKIAIASANLANVDIDAAYQAKIDTFLANRDHYSTLITTINNKMIQLNNAIDTGASLTDVNSVIDEIRALAKGDLYNYYTVLGLYYNSPLPTVGTNGYDEVNAYLNIAGDVSWSIAQTLLQLDVRMQLLSQAYTATVQQNLHDTYNTLTDTDPNSCSVANYHNTVTLEPQLIGQCQMAYFYTCGITVYGSSYPDKVLEMQNRIRTYCSILNDYQPFTLDGSNPKDQCDFCSGY